MDEMMLWIGLAAGGIMILLLILLLRQGAGRLVPLEQHLQSLGQSLQTLNNNQHELAGGLKSVGDQQAAAQSAMLLTMERRLEEVQAKMAESLSGTATRTAHSLGELQERLKAIDKAQSNIEKLSGDVLGLQDILSNKQTRGAFGEIQLQDIVQKALPSDSYSFQASLSNGTRADCMIHMPNPPGPIVIDSKFPLEAYEALVAAKDERAQKEAAGLFRRAIRTHIKAISERYIIEGETADGALMFLPSEAVYAELHARFSELVREGFAARVWIVSPTTCMATLHTMRAVLKDARMKAQAGVIRRELGMLYKDVERLEARVGNLDRHFALASKDISEIRLSSSKAGQRARKLENFDFEELAGPEAAPQSLAEGLAELSQPEDLEAK